MLFEYIGKVLYAYIADLIGNVANLRGRVHPQQLCRLLHPYLGQEFDIGFSCCLMEHIAQVTRRDAYFLGNQGKAYGLGIMRINIFLRL